MLSLDWRSRGVSDRASTDFGSEDLLPDALTVIADSEAQTVLPVALVHAGWVAIELRGHFGDAVPNVVAVDWIVTPAPASVLCILESLRSTAGPDEAWPPAREIERFMAGLAGRREARRVA
jgi:hypothetical protein